MKKVFYVLAVAAVTMFTSCETVDPGHKGVEVSWGGETNMETVYPEGLSSGLHWIFDEMVPYDCREQTLVLNEEFLDYDGLATTVEVILYYAPVPGEVNKLHTQVGHDYRDTKLRGVFKGAVKTVIAQHKALLLNREERPEAENQLQLILEEELSSMYIDYKRVQITDVDLPPKIKRMIEAAKEQDEKNNLSAKKELEAKNLANAQIARAKGEYTAATYDAKTKEILSQPKMIKLMKVENERLMWEGFLKHGVSPYGNNNVYSGENGGVGIWKSTK